METYANQPGTTYAFLPCVMSTRRLMHPTHFRTVTGTSLPLTAPAANHSTTHRIELERIRARLRM